MPEFVRNNEELRQQSGDPQPVEGESARSGGQDFSVGNVIPPEHQPGTVGHTNARNQQPRDMTPAEEIHEGAHTGSSRSVHIHQPIRKTRSA